LQATNDRETLRFILPVMRDIVSHHIGHMFGIGVDPRDGLLRQGAAGYQLTWMDAKVGDWVSRRPRQSRRDQRALAQRAAAARRWASEEGPANEQEAPALVDARSKFANRSISGSGTPAAATFSTS